MKIIVDPCGCFLELGKLVSQLAAEGYKNIMLLLAEGGVELTASSKMGYDMALRAASRNGVQIFGGVFPGIFDGEVILDTGAILIGIKSDVHVVTLENISADNVADLIETERSQICDKENLRAYQTIFAFGDGYGENNLHLINGLNAITQKQSVHVLGGLTGRVKVGASHFTILTPQKVIQNGAVLAFTNLASGIGVQHGWEPLKGTELIISQTNGCNVERINSVPAFNRYIQLIASYDENVAAQSDMLFKDPQMFFKLAVKYPLGIVRSNGANVFYVDRTPMSVGGDKSLQFSAEIPEGTRACILHLKGESYQERCLTLSQAAKQAYMEGNESFPAAIQNKRVIMMDCYGRKLVTEAMKGNYSRVELDEIVRDQRHTPHSPDLLAPFRTS